MNHYTLDQLAGMNSGEEKPAKFAVIGNPVAHSLSPQLHNPALEAWKDLDPSVTLQYVDVPGDGRFEWQGFLELEEHPHASDSPDGRLLN